MLTLQLTWLWVELQISLQCGIQRFHQTWWLTATLFQTITIGAASPLFLRWAPGGGWTCRFSTTSHQLKSSADQTAALMSSTELKYALVIHWRTMATTIRGALTVTVHPASSCYVKKTTPCWQICIKVGGRNNHPALLYFSLPPRCAVITVISDVLMGFSCGQMTGRYVNIVIPGEGQRLQLCEVRVYASTDITGGKTTLINDMYS